MVKIALDYEKDFSEEGLHQALLQRGIAVDEARIPEGLKTRMSRLAYLATQWDREHLDDANETYAKDVASFGRKAMASQEQSSTTNVPALVGPRTDYDFDAFLDHRYDSVPPSGEATNQSGDDNAGPSANPSGSLPDSIKQEYSYKLTQMTQLWTKLKDVKADLIDIQNRAGNINRRSSWRGRTRTILRGSAMSS